MLGSLILAIVVYGMFYGGVMGSYGGMSGCEVLASRLLGRQGSVPLDHDVSS